MMSSRTLSSAMLIAFGAISISAPTTRIVQADTAELGRLLGRHATELSNALSDKTGAYSTARS